MQHDNSKRGCVVPCVGLLGVKGGFRVTKDPSGKGNLEVGISAVNAADPSFLPPRETYSTLAFPKTFLPDDDWGFNEYTAHFMSLCMKVGPVAAIANAL